MANESSVISEVINIKEKFDELRVVDRGLSVGYGSVHRVTEIGRAATMAVGHGDGYRHAFGNRGCCYRGEALLPALGRVSMNLAKFDATIMLGSGCRRGVMTRRVGKGKNVDCLTFDAATRRYEIVPRPRHPSHREYRGAV